MRPSKLTPLYLYTGPPVERPRQLYDYLLAGQGIVKRVENRFISTDHLLVPIETPLTGLGLKGYRLQPLRLKQPRIPGRLLEAVLADARTQPELEVVYHFRYGPKRGWWVTRPAQQQHRTWLRWVEYQQADIVVELHSHHQMPAFFSPTDDGNDQGGRLYAVMGKLEWDRPQLCLRAGLYGHWQPDVPARRLFTHLGPFVQVEAGLTFEAEPEAGGFSFADLVRGLTW